MSGRENVSDIQKYYGGNAEDLRYERQQLEFLVTARILEGYLDRPRRILELGAGSGFYTGLLAERGHTVHAVDFSAELTEANRRSAEGAEWRDRVSFQVADARDVATLGEGEYDAILVMGPLYHLTDAGERKAMVKALVARLAPEGLMFAAHLTRVGCLGYRLYKFPGWIAPDATRAARFLSRGVETDHPKDGSFRGYFATLAEVEAFDREAGLVPVAVHAQDPLVGGVDEVFNRLPPELKVAWAAAIAAISTESDLRGSARSLLSVGRRPG